VKQKKQSKKKPTTFPLSADVVGWAFVIGCILGFQLVENWNATIAPSKPGKDSASSRSRKKTKALLSDPETLCDAED